MKQNSYNSKEACYSIDASHEGLATRKAQRNDHTS